MRITINSLQKELQAAEYKIHSLEDQIAKLKTDCELEVRTKDYYHRVYLNQSREIQVVKDFLQVVMSGTDQKLNDLIESLPLIGRLGLWLSMKNKAKLDCGE